MSKALHDSALDSLGVPSEADSIRSFRSVCSTDTGARWLEQAIDPMHDRGVSSASMPDNISGRSVVQVITRRFTVTAPDTGKFDALVQFTADLNTNRMADATLHFDTPTLAEGGSQAYLDIVGNATAVTYGGVTVQTGAVGADLTRRSNYIAAPWFNGTDPASQWSDFPSGGYRLVGGSLEVYNTTPELYASGSSVCYRQSNRQDSFRNIQMTGTTTAIDGAFPDVQLYPKGPTSVGAAQMIPDSVAMKAVDGCYMPFVVNTSDIIEHGKYGVFVVASRIDSTANQNILMNRAIVGGDNPTASQVGNWSLPHRCQPLGAYFSGLSPETSLDVVCRFIIEVFPNVTDSVLMPLTRPSAPYDARALEAYRMVMASMPIAVPVAWNGLGTWLKTAMKAIKPVAKFLQPVAKAIVTEALPGGDAIWHLGAATGNAVKESLSKRKKKKKDADLTQRGR